MPLVGSDYPFSPTKDFYAAEDKKIAPDGDTPERRRYDEPILKDRLWSAIQRTNAISHPRFRKKLSKKLSELIYKKRWQIMKPFIRCAPKVSKSVTVKIAAIWSG